MIIYVAGKYYALSVGERLKNTHKAIDWGIKIYGTWTATGTETITTSEWKLDAAGVFTAASSTVIFASPDCGRKMYSGGTDNNHAFYNWLRWKR